MEHMSAHEFRRQGHAVIDWVAGYLERVEDLPVLAQVAPGDVRARLAPHAPEHGEPFARILDDVEDVLLPGLTHWQSPNFFAYFPANTSHPSILGELLSAGLGVQGMLWTTSPAATELETHVLDWFVELLGLPAAFRGNGVIQDSASSAVLCALVAARERAGGGQRLTVYASTQAHSSVEKACRIAGLGGDALRLVDVDQRYALDVDHLGRLLAADRAAGATPCMVVATVGTTSSTAVDPVAAIGALCRREGVWLHVDAAYAGVAAICPELRWLSDGVELADSWCTNAHKWLLVNFDCDLFFVRDRVALVGALSVLPEYLRNQATESGAVVDYRDWQIPLGRRFRALKLWFVVRHYGAEGLRAFVRHGVALARRLAGWIAEDPDFELGAPAPLALVCFRHRGGDQVNEALLAAVNATGGAYLTHTRLDGRYTLRMSVGGWQTERRHVEAVWRLIKETAAC